MFYNCMVTSIRVIWKKQVMHENFNNIERWSDDVILYINKKLIPIKKSVVN